uniref:SAM and SH3 domain-containing protein 1-like n=1 Tax=Myxine glutinosa TaxID=7769 RepID=UPI00358F201B
MQAPGRLGPPQGVVAEWLRALGLGGYAQAFLDNGYDDLEICRQIGAPDLDAIGVCEPRHRLLLLSAVARLARPEDRTVYFTLEEAAAAALGAAPSCATPGSPATLASRRLSRPKLRALLREHLVRDGVSLSALQNGGTHELERLARSYASCLNVPVDEVYQRLQEMQARQMARETQDSAPDINPQHCQTQVEVSLGFRSALSTPEPERKACLLKSTSEDDAVGRGDGKKKGKSFWLSLQRTPNRTPTRTPNCTPNRSPKNSCIQRQGSGHVNFVASEITMSDEDRIELMTMVKDRRITIDQALSKLEEYETLHRHCLKSGAACHADTGKDDACSSLDCPGGPSHEDRTTSAGLRERRHLVKVEDSGKTFFYADLHFSNMDVPCLARSPPEYEEPPLVLDSADPRMMSSPPLQRQSKITGLGPALARRLTQVSMLAASPSIRPSSGPCPKARSLCSTPEMRRGLRSRRLRANVDDYSPIKVSGSGVKMTTEEGIHLNTSSQQITPGSPAPPSSPPFVVSLGDIRAARRRMQQRRAYSGSTSDSMMGLRNSSSSSSSGGGSGVVDYGAVAFSGGSVHCDPDTIVVTLECQRNSETSASSSNVGDDAEPRLPGVAEPTAGEHNHGEEVDAAGSGLRCGYSPVELAVETTGLQNQDVVERRDKKCLLYRLNRRSRTSSFGGFDFPCRFHTASPELADTLPRQHHLNSPSHPRTNGDTVRGHTVLPEVGSHHPQEGGVHQALKGKRRSRRPKPQTVEELLQRLGLEPYWPLLTQNGYEDLDTFQLLEVEDLEEMSFPGPDQHRAALLAAAALLRRAACDKRRVDEAKNIADGVAAASANPASLPTEEDSTANRQKFQSGKWEWQEEAGRLPLVVEAGGSKSQPGLAQDRRSKPLAIRRTWSWDERWQDKTRCLERRASLQNIICQSVEEKTSLKDLWSQKNQLEKAEVEGTRRKSQLKMGRRMDAYGNVVFNPDDLKLNKTTGEHHSIGQEDLVLQGITKVKEMATRCQEPHRQAIPNGLEHQISATECMSERVDQMPKSSKVTVLENRPAPPQPKPLFSEGFRSRAAKVSGVLQWPDDDEIRPDSSSSTEDQAKRVAPDVPSTESAPEESGALRGGSRECRSSGGVRGAILRLNAQHGLQARGK